MSRLRKGTVKKEGTPSQLPGYSVFIVTGGIDPLLRRPRFLTSAERDRYMKDIYPSQVDEESGDLPCFLNVSRTGRITMGPYSRDWFTPTKDNTTLTVSVPVETHPATS